MSFGPGYKPPNKSWEDLVFETLELEENEMSIGRSSIDGYTESRSRLTVNETAMERASAGSQSSVKGFNDTGSPFLREGKALDAYDVGSRETPRGGIGGESEQDRLNRTIASMQVELSALKTQLKRLEEEKEKENLIPAITMKDGVYLVTLPGSKQKHIYVRRGAYASFIPSDDSRVPAEPHSFTSAISFTAAQACTALRKEAYVCNFKEMR